MLLCLGFGVQGLEFRGSGFRVSFLFLTLVSFGDRNTTSLVGGLDTCFQGRSGRDSPPSPLPMEQPLHFTPETASQVVGSELQEAYSNHS